MNRKLTALALLLFAPLPAFASGGDSANLVIGGAAVAVLVCVALVATKRAWGLAAASLLGILVAGYLTVQHSSTAESICNINSVWNCDVVNRSAYSEIAGIPIALLGVAFYAVMAYQALRHASGGAPKAPAVMTVLAGFAVAYDIFLAYASYSLGAFCPLCVVSWSINLVLLFGCAMAWRAGGESLVDSVKDELGGVAVVGLLTIIIGGLASRDSSSASSGPSDAGEDLSRHYEQAAGSIEIDGTEPVEGPADARFTLVEWADYECPHCALMSEEMPKILEDNPDVKLLFKHYPISGNCNQFVDGERHQYACNAAAAAECARLQGKFWDLSRQMFKNQQFLGKEDIRFMVNQLGLDAAAFETCMGDPSTEEAVKQDIAAGAVAKINGTPSIFAKGVIEGQWIRFTADREGIEAVLAAVRAGKPLPAPRPPSDQ